MKERTIIFIFSFVIWAIISSLAIKSSFENYKYIKSLKNYKYVITDQLKILDIPKILLEDIKKKKPNEEFNKMFRLR